MQIRAPWRITNGFLHDLGTGTWFACVLVTAVLRSHVAQAPDQAVTALAAAMHDVFVLALVALGTIVVTGVVRLLYWRAVTPQAEIADKRRLLIIKHVGFAIVYGAGSVWLYAQIPA